MLTSMGRALQGRFAKHTQKVMSIDGFYKCTTFVRLYVSDRTLCLFDTAAVSRLFVSEITASR